MPQIDPLTTIQADSDMKFARQRERTGRREAPTFGGPWEFCLANSAAAIAADTPSIELTVVAAPRAALDNSRRTGRNVCRFSVNARASTARKTHAAANSFVT